MAKKKERTKIKNKLATGEKMKITAISLFTELFIRYYQIYIIRRSIQIKKMPPFPVAF